VGVEVIKIEGVFSGTLSYIFNEFSQPTTGGPTFSSVVAKARELGYTVRLPPLSFATFMGAEISLLATGTPSGG
jgi:hypothetical protein